jgi:hypothetical protein
MNYLNIKILAFFVLLFAAFIACEEQTEWELQKTEPFIVVDALITSEFKEQEIYVYSSTGTLNGSSIPIHDAAVSIFDGSNYHSFVYSGNQGLYISEPFAGVINKKYALLIDYQGISDTAFAEMEPITSFKNDTLIYKDGLFQFLYGGSDSPAMTEVYYDWSVVPEYCSLYGSCSASNTFYTINSLDAANEFGSEKQEIWCPSGTTLIRRKYSLSDAHQDFVRSLLIETEWRGGLFDIEQGNVPTNYKNGIRGWFAVCTVISDTVLVNSESDFLY